MIDPPTDNTTERTYRRMAAPLLHGMRRSIRRLRGVIATSHGRSHRLQKIFGAGADAEALDDRAELLRVDRPLGAPPFGRWHRDRGARPHYLPCPKHILAFLAR